MTLFAFRVYPRGHLIRRSAALASVFTLIEAAFGAWLVLRGLVDTDESAERFWAVGLHFINTLFLLVSLVCTWQWSRIESKTLFYSKRELKLITAVASLFIAIGVTGSISSMSTTLYPSQSLLGGALADFSDSSPWPVRLRLLHPIFALVCSWGIFSLMGQMRVNLKLIGTLLITQVLVGLMTLLQLSPLPLRLAHLLVGLMIVIAIATEFSKLSNKTD